MAAWFDCDSCGGAHECLDGETLERAVERAHNEATVLDDPVHVGRCAFTLTHWPTDRRRFYFQREVRRELRGLWVLRLGKWELRRW